MNNSADALVKLMAAIQTRKDKQNAWTKRTGKDQWFKLLDELRSAEAAEEEVFQEVAALLRETTN
jgi:hypothetical protein